MYLVVSYNLLISSVDRIKMIYWNKFFYIVIRTTTILEFLVFHILHQTAYNKFQWAKTTCSNDWVNTITFGPIVIGQIYHIKLCSRFHALNISIVLYFRGLDLVSQGKKSSAWCNALVKQQCRWMISCSLRLFFGSSF